MGLHLTVVDTFADRPFTGNPAAVAVVERFPADERMQAVASEMNLAATAFVVPCGGDVYELRWFTPSVEVDVCGHATLAAAHVVGGFSRFRTRSGELACAVRADGTVELSLPADPPSEVAPPAALAGWNVQWFGLGRQDALVELADREAVESYRPDPAVLATLAPRGVAVTAADGAAGVDFVSRFFAPNAGIPEDPVCGSAHAMLGPHWYPRTGRAELVAEQCSARGGRVLVRMDGERVGIGGRAITTSQVTLVV